MSEFLLTSASRFGTHVAKSYQHIRRGTVRQRLQLAKKRRVRRRERERKLAWRSKSNPIVVSVVNGAMLKLHRDSELSRQIASGHFEFAEQLFVSSYLDHGDLFIDIGANIGLFSVIAARAVGPAGRVLAFEPADRPFQRLKENIQLNGFRNVECYPLAVSDSTDTSTLKVPADGYDAWSSLASPGLRQGVSERLVSCTTIDNVVSSVGTNHKPNLVKIDVEGWEIHVLKGGSRLLSLPNAPVLLVEFTEQNAVAAGTTCKRLYRIIEDYGYQLYTYDAKRNTLSCAPPQETYPYINLIATKDANETERKLRSRDMSLRFQSFRLYVSGRS